MTTIDLLEKLTKHATEYRKDAKNSLIRNNHMNDISSDEVIEQEIIDSVLVDFINFIGMKHCVDYALYTDDINLN